MNPRLRGDKRNRKVEKLYNGKLHNLYTSRIFATLSNDIRQNVMGGRGNISLVQRELKVDRDF